MSAAVIRGGPHEVLATAVPSPELHPAARQRPVRARACGALVDRVGTERSRPLRNPGIAGDDHNLHAAAHVAIVCAATALPSAERARSVKPRVEALFGDAEGFDGIPTSGRSTAPRQPNPGPWIGTVSVYSTGNVA